jgi:hypothetical protein
MTRVDGRPGKGAKLYMGCPLALVLAVVAVLVFLAPAWWPWAH